MRPAKIQLVLIALLGLFVLGLRPFLLASANAKAPVQKVNSPAPVTPASVVHPASENKPPSEKTDTKDEDEDDEDENAPVSDPKFEEGVDEEA